MINQQWLCDKYINKRGINGVWRDKNGFVLSYCSKCPVRTRAWLRLRRYVGSWPVRFQKAPEFKALRTTKHRPAVGGISVGHPNITAGTLGVFVERAGGVYIKSNNHVLAAQNDANIGDSTLQPGVHDGGLDPADKIAVLADYVPIKFDGSDNVVDLAISGPLATGDYKREILEVPYPTAVMPSVPLGTKVFKSGRTTARTDGEVVGVDATLNVGYANGLTARYVKQLIVQGKPLDEPIDCPLGIPAFCEIMCNVLNNEPPFCQQFEKFSDGGDSGSAVLSDVNGETHYVGLLFAGSTTTTIVNLGNEVFAALPGMRLLSDEPPDDDPPPDDDCNCPCPAHGDARLCKLW